MTPKEKAKELVESFYDTTPNEAWMNEPLCLASKYSAKEQAKQCALIAVAVAEKALFDYGSGDSFQLQNMESEWRFWDEVKQEIQNIKTN